MAYESSVWLGSIAALCPSEDSAGDGTTTLTDFTGVSNGTLTNMDPATDWVTDDGKRCLDFDGSNDYVATGNCPIGGARRISISVWFRRTATTGPGLYMGIATNIALSTNRFLIYHFSDGNFYFQLDSGYGSFAFALTDVAWHSLIVQYDGTQATNADRLKVWLDGVAKTLTFIGSVSANADSLPSAELYIGALPNSPTVYGACRVDDIRILPRLFTVDERAEIDASRGGTYAEASGGGGIPIARGMHGGMR